MKKELSTGCIIINDNKVLLVKSLNHDGGFYGFPKGHQEPGETDEQTALRETMEEVGLKVKITDYEPFYNSYIIKNGTVLKEVHLFLAELDGEDQEVSIQEEELSAAEWVPIDIVLDTLNSTSSDFYTKLWGEVKERLSLKK